MPSRYAAALSFRAARLLRLARTRAGRWSAAIAAFAAVLIFAIWVVTLKRVQLEYDDQVAAAFRRS
ncbi:MAG TPA: hypothetical protein VFB01_16615 [Burkholderiales bacterium]|nr:hypothetical protein [Burkholderiales bacterium]